MFAEEDNIDNLKSWETTVSQLFISYFIQSKSSNSFLFFELISAIIRYTVKEKGVPFSC
jgi:hypothetical protein